MTAGDIAHGIEADEFFPVFQPVIELRTGQLAGFEVLARWQRTGGELVMPDEFIPAAERAGLIRQLSRAIFTKALPAIPRSNRAQLLGFNISPTQLLDLGLSAEIESLAASVEFPLDRLVLEITESALLDDFPRAASVAHALREMGCRLSLDDFGTGYSSLTHLHELPFEALKVDRAFVNSMTRKRESRKIVASVVGLGQSLGLSTVAEGVETREQAEMLFWMGCDLAQGWLFGRPVPEAEVPALLAVGPREPVVAAPTALDGSQVMHDPVPAYRVAQLQAIYDSVPVGLCFLDREMRYVNLNRQLAQMNGVPAASHIGRKVSEVIPHVFPLVEPFIRRALRGEPVQGVEVMKPPEDGSGSHAVMLSYQPVRDEAGDVLGVSVAAMDVTERKRTEEALRESEDQYRHMMSLSPHVPWVLDADGAVVQASDRWTEFTGQPMDDAMRNGWLSMLHPDDVPATVAAIRKSLESGVPIDVEYRIRRPDEEWRWMRARGAPRFNSDGKVISIYGVLEEIDQQKRATEEWQICEAELRTAVNAVPVGILLADAHDGTVFTINPAARETFGSGAFAGQNIREYPKMGLLDKDSVAVAAGDYPLARSIQRGETVESRPFLLRRGDGSLRPISVSSRPIRSDQGKLIGGLMMIRDPEAKA